jgi:hypothetical protein
MDTKANEATEVKEAQHHDGDQDNKSIVELVSVVASPGDLLSLGEIDHALTAKKNFLNDVCLR